MNKALIWAVLAIVVLAGVWYYVLTQPQGGAPSPTATTTVATTSAPAAQTPVSPKKTSTAPKVTAPKVSGYNSISYLLTQKEPLVCTMRVTSPVSRSGTIYVAGGKMRGNFGTAAMIDDGTYLYAWKSGATKGLQLLAAQSASGSAVMSLGALDLETPFSFACNAWSTDQSLFIPPASISFSNTL